MKVLIIDHNNCGLDHAMRMQDSGHEVLLAPYGNTRLGDGLVRKVVDWEAKMKWADLVVVTDNAYYISRLEPYFKEGYPIFGCNQLGGELELDREYGQEILSRCGIPTLQCQPFYSYKEAIDFVLKNNKIYVVKPMGDADKALSYVPSEVSDLLFTLDHNAKNHPLKKGFVLQEKVDGIEMAVGGWFGPQGWSRYLCENWEEKKFLNDNLGCNTGEQGTTLRYVTQSKLFREVLKPVEEYLHAIGYVGYIDMNCIIDKKTGQPYPLEFTTRFGWPLANIQIALHEVDEAEWMLDLLQGRDTLEVSRDIAVGVVLSHRDYPYNSEPLCDCEGFPLYGVTEDNYQHLHFQEAMLGKNLINSGGKLQEEDALVTAGRYVLVATGVGSSVTKAAEAAYKTMWELKVPSNRGFRTDISKRLEKQLPELQKFGYARGMKY